MLRLVPVLALLVLTGCQTMTVEERREADRQTCRDYGFKRNNDAFAQCMQRLDLDRRDARRANQAYLDDWQRDYWRRRYYW